jgi:hypothetical protein
MLKTRTLYQVLYFRDIHSCSRPVGFKGRLLPRFVALRVAKRLRRSGFTIKVVPFPIKLTAAQLADLQRRYG